MIVIVIVIVIVIARMEMEMENQSFDRIIALEDISKVLE